MEKLKTMECLRDEKFLENSFGLSSKDIGKKFEQNNWKSIFSSNFLTGSDLAHIDISEDYLSGGSYIIGKSVHLILNDKLLDYDDRNYDTFSIIIEPRVYINNENYCSCFYLVKFSKGGLTKDTVFLSCPVHTFTEISGVVSNMLIDNLVI